MVAIRAWYLERSLREQRLMAAMVLIALPLLLYVLLVVPLTRAYQDSLQAQLLAIDRNGRVKAMAERTARGGPSVPPVADLSLFLADNARAGGLNVSAERGAAPALAAVRIEPASAASVFGWIRQLETQGYRIESMRLAPNGDGLVGADLVVRGGAK